MLIACTPRVCAQHMVLRAARNYFWRLCVLRAAHMEACPQSLMPSLLPPSNTLCAVIPPFHAAIDRAVSYLDGEEGLLGVADFFTSGKYDLPLRQVSITLFTRTKTKT